MTFFFSSRRRHTRYIGDWSSDVCSSDLAQFRELAAFAQFGSDLDKATQAQLARGQRLTEILKQPQYAPMPVEKQVIIIWAATSGYLDDVPVDQARRFEAELAGFIENSHPGLLAALSEKKALTDEIKADLKTAITDFKQTWNAAPPAPRGTTAPTATAA